MSTRVRATLVLCLLAGKRHGYELVGFWRPIDWLAVDAVFTGSHSRFDDPQDDNGFVGRYIQGSVEQAGFAVLKAPDIPSILVETAFISNPAEEKKLKDDAYQQKLAESILSGIKLYFTKNPALARQRMATNP